MKSSCQNSIIVDMLTSDKSAIFLKYPLILWRVTCLKSIFLQVLLYKVTIVLCNFSGFLNSLLFFLYLLFQFAFIFLITSGLILFSLLIFSIDFFITKWSLIIIQSIWSSNFWNWNAFILSIGFSITSMNFERISS